MSKFYTVYWYTYKRMLAVITKAVDVKGNYLCVYRDYASTASAYKSAVYVTNPMGSMVSYNTTERKVILGNGSVITFMSADSVEDARGNEYTAVFINEMGVINSKFDEAIASILAKGASVG